MRITARQLRQIIREELARESSWQAGSPMMTADEGMMHGEEEDEGMYEGQRGNDENSQHDNDTDPGDPYARRLKEARNRAARRR